MWILKKSPKKTKKFKIRKYKKYKNPLILERARKIKYMRMKQRRLVPKNYLRIPGFKLYWRRKRKKTCIAESLKGFAKKL